MLYLKNTRKVIRFTVLQKFLYKFLIRTWFQKYTVFYKYIRYLDGGPGLPDYCISGNIMAAYFIDGSGTYQDAIYDVL